MVFQVQTIFTPLPQGKPDPSLPYTFPDSRPRVEQAAQKGNTCWYYALAMMRERIGKHPTKEFMDARKFEKCASKRRKMQTLAYELYTDRRDIARQVQTDPNYTRHNLNTKEGASQMVQRLREILATEEGSLDQRKEVRRLLGLLSAYVKSSQESLDEFVLHKYSEQRMKINLVFLKEVGVSIEELSPIHGISVQEYNQLPLQEKIKYLDNWTFCLCYRRYGFSESLWSPKDGLNGLITELKKQKCLYVKGRFGKQYYVDDPIRVGTLQGQAIYGWKKGSQKTPFRQSHSVVLVGASSKGLIYFVDPLDGSSPNDPTQQRVYVMSYNTFKKQLFALKSTPYMHEEQVFSDGLQDRFCLISPDSTFPTEEKKS